MKSSFKKSLSGLGIFLLTVSGALSSGAVLGADYPKEPIQWVVPYAPGAASDTLARRVAKDLGEQLNTTIVVENQPGAGTVNASRKLKRSKADGYTVMNADISTLALNPNVLKDPGYVTSDFTMISMLTQFPFVLVVRPDLPAQTTSELIQYAKENPEKLNFASAGMNSPHHLAMELLMEEADIQMTHLPFNGTGPALTELLAGRVDLMFSTIGTVNSHIANGKLKALGISSQETFDGLEDIKPLHTTDSSLKNYQMYGWQGLIAPAGLPADVIEKLNLNLKNVLENPQLVADFKALGLEAKWTPSKDFSTYVDEQNKMWGKIIKDKGLEAK